MKRKITDIKFIVFLTIIFLYNVWNIFYTVNMNNTEILIKASRNLKGVQENTVNSKQPIVAQVVILAKYKITIRKYTKNY